MSQFFSIGLTQKEFADIVENIAELEVIDIIDRRPEWDRNNLLQTMESQSREIDASQEVFADGAQPVDDAPDLDQGQRGLLMVDIGGA